jgi:hypothetical protein
MRSTVPAAMALVLAILSLYSSRLERSHKPRHRGEVFTSTCPTYLTSKQLDLNPPAPKGRTGREAAHGPTRGGCIRAVDYRDFDDSDPNEPPFSPYYRHEIVSLCLQLEPSSANLEHSIRGSSSGTSLPTCGCSRASNPSFITDVAYI